MARSADSKDNNGKTNGKLVLSERYQKALSYPLFDSIFNRRSRRFGLGMKLEDPTLGFESKYDPVPLEEMEEALLVWAGTGLTGLCLADLPPETGIDLLCQWTGRTWPSACNNHGTELFFTNDSGLYHVNVKNMLPKNHELDMFFKMSKEERMARILELYRESLVKLEDGRAQLPDKMPGLFEFNQWNTNKPGTSVFIPVTDVTEEYINLLHLYCSNSYGFTIIDDLTGKPAGVEKWIQKGRLKDNIKALALRPRSENTHGAERRASIHMPEHEPRAPGPRACGVDVQRVHTEVRSRRSAAALQGARVQVHTAEEGHNRSTDDRACRKGRRLPRLLPSLL